MLTFVAKKDILKIEGNVKKYKKIRKGEESI